MSVDNRTVINDCEAGTGWTGDDAVTVVNDAGAFYEGSNSLSWQASDVDEQMSTTQDSVGATTFSLDWSDSTLYLLVKDNLGVAFSLGGVQFVIGDGTDLTGYDVGGNDAGGLLLPTYFQSYKLDVSVVVTTPGSFTDHAGTEANLDQTAITAIGYGSVHTDKANGPSDNVFMDCFRYIANDSYALTINGGTAGTPETMVDVAGDDVTNGWGMIGNPIGSQYWFFAPTEWGNVSTIAEHAFTASNEQWYWLGDNGGGHAVGTGHFIFRVTANATDAGSFILNSVVIVNTGTGANFDCSDSDIDVLEMDLCTIVGLDTFVGPVAGGTSRFVENTTFIQCGTITHSGASMNGSAVNDSAVLADTGALYYNTNADPNGEMDNMTFIKHATVLHHALEFGTTAPLTMTLTGWTTEDFSASDGDNHSTFLFPDTGGDVTWTVNITDGTGNFTYKKVRATDTVIISSSVAVEINGLTEGSRAVMSDQTTPATEYLSGWADSTGTVSGSYTGSVPITVDIKARNGGVVNAVIQDDGGVFTDFTDEARDTTTGTGIGTANDVDLLPATVTIADATYIAGVAEFGNVDINISTAGTTYVGVWEYWNGAWVSLTLTDDPTNDFQTAGWGRITFTKPGDWATTSVNSQGPFYYIRFRVTTGGGTQPQAEEINLGDTVKYLPYNATGTIVAGTGLVATAQWDEDTTNP